VARMGEGSKVYRVLRRKPEGKRPLWRPRRMGSERILGGLAGGVERIQLTQDRGRFRSLVNTVMDLRVLAPRS
jgi:hypothetical protein